MDYFMSIFYRTHIYAPENFNSKCSNLKMPKTLVHIICLFVFKTLVYDKTFYVVYSGQEERQQK